MIFRGDSIPSFMASMFSFVFLCLASEKSAKLFSNAQPLVILSPLLHVLIIIHHMADGLLPLRKHGQLLGAPSSQWQERNTPDSVLCGIVVRTTRHIHNKSFMGQGGFMYMQVLFLIIFPVNAT